MTAAQTGFVVHLADCCHAGISESVKAEESCCSEKTPDSLCCAKEQIPVSCCMESLEEDCCDEVPTHEVIVSPKPLNAVSEEGFAMVLAPLSNPG